MTPVIYANHILRLPQHVVLIPVIMGTRIKELLRTYNNSQLPWHSSLSHQQCIISINDTMFEPFFQQPSLSPSPISPSDL